MAYFPDLSPYEYGLGPDPTGFRSWEHRDAVHVGWLDGTHDYSKGAVAPHLLEKLKRLAKHPVELYRGFHVCELCPHELQIQQPREICSNGEIRISLRTLIDSATLKHPENLLPASTEIESGLISYRKITYAAPILITHYIEAHGYLPPADFLQALESVPE
jgi:hypothetical protein